MCYALGMGKTTTKQEVEVEVTPDMIEAAWFILDQYDHDYSDAKKCLTDIFRAMKSAQRHPAKAVQGKQ